MTHTHIETESTMTLTMEKSCTLCSGYRASTMQRRVSDASKHVCGKENCRPKNDEIQQGANSEFSCTKQHPRSSFLSLYTHTHTWWRVSAEHVLCISVWVKAAGLQGVAAVVVKRRERKSKETQRSDFKRWSRKRNQTNREEEYERRQRERNAQVVM